MLREKLSLFRGGLMSGCMLLNLKSGVTLEVFRKMMSMHFGLPSNVLSGLPGRMIYQKTALEKPWIFFAGSDLLKECSSV